jgi:hypothetical protein
VKKFGKIVGSYGKFEEKITGALIKTCRDFLQL